MTHKQKLTMARRMMSKNEVKSHIPPFESKAWEDRKEAIQKRISK